MLFLALKFKVYSSDYLVHSLGKAFLFFLPSHYSFPGPSVLGLKLNKKKITCSSGWLS